MYAVCTLACMERDSVAAWLNFWQVDSNEEHISSLSDLNFNATETHTVREMAEKNVRSLFYFYQRVRKDLLHFRIRGTMYISTYLE